MKDESIKSMIQRGHFIFTAEYKKTIGVIIYEHGKVALVAKARIARVNGIKERVVPVDLIVTLNKYSDRGYLYMGNINDVLPEKNLEEMFDESEDDVDE